MALKPAPPTHPCTVPSFTVLFHLYRRRTFARSQQPAGVVASGTRFSLSSHGSQSHHPKLTTQEKVDGSRAKAENEHIQHPQRKASSNGRTPASTPQRARTYRALCPAVHPFDFTVRDWAGESLKLGCHGGE